MGTKLQNPVFTQLSPSFMHRRFLICRPPLAAFQPPETSFLTDVSVVFLLREGLCRRLQAAVSRTPPARSSECGSDRPSQNCKGCDQATGPAAWALPPARAALCGDSELLSELYTGHHSESEPGLLPPAPPPVSLSPSCPVPPQFVLKHEALAHLREVACFPNTLNPHEAESLALVGAMIDQVMGLHPGARWLHVGCDEVGAFVASSAPQFCSSAPVFSSRTSWLPLLHRKMSVCQRAGPPEGAGAADLTSPRPGGPVSPAGTAPRPPQSRGQGGAAAAVLPTPGQWAAGQPGPRLQGRRCEQVRAGYFPRRKQRSLGVGKRKWYFGATRATRKRRCQGPCPTPAPLSASLHEGGTEPAAPCGWT